jgi:signal transduction histidine kinase
MVGQDITELIEYRQNLEAKVQERTRELNDALHKEKDLVEMKSKFVSIASHEFRTPLSTISLASGILRKHKDALSPVEFNSRVDTIEKQVRHMTYLLDDILIIGKADAGKIQTVYTPVSILNFFRQVATEVEQNSGTHKIRFQCKTTETNFACDEKLLRNITINLLTNAIKFSPDREFITLNISATSGMLTIEITDRGIGITDEDLKNIFTSFHRGTNVGAIPGTGLGLSIVKKAVDLLMGNIKIQSQVTKGTTFIVTLPLQPLNTN